MLDSFYIYNGTFTPEFDPYCNTYTVYVDIDVDSLDIVYTSKGDVAIINNSDFINGENIVSLEVNENGKINTYTLYVYKKEISVSTFSEKEITSLENTVKTPDYIAPLIASICFIIILLFFKLLIVKKK